MARAKIRPKKEAFLIRSVTLTAPTEKTLQRLSGAASDSLGWTVSNSAIVRALLCYAEQQPPGWPTSFLFPFIEREIASGSVWGKKK